MQHPFISLRAEYASLLSTMRVLRPIEIDRVAQKLMKLANIERYRQVSKTTGVPAALIAALDERESGADPTRALGQGDPWYRVSTHVPRGKGPFKSWIEAAEFYVEYDHLNDQSAPWTWPYVCWKSEAWNGFGPRNHGIYTGYLWAGTNHYERGKYVADGKWDPKFVDRQIGVIPLMFRLVALDPSLDFDPDVDELATFDHVGSPPIAPLPAPVGTRTGTHDTLWLQTALNRAYLPADAQLELDGSYGRRTREAVRSFQRFNQLEPDGLFGPVTDAALTAAMGSVT